MDRLAFNAVAAINVQANSRQMATNELANVSTVGFKRSYQLAMSAVNIEGPGMKTRFQPQASEDDFINLKPGSVMATGRELDVVMSQQAVLAVTAPNGDLAFTRRGDLRINPQGVLENGSGHLVRGQNGGPITLPPGLIISIKADGTVFGTDPGQPSNTPPQNLGALLMRDAGQTQLVRRTDGLFEPAGKPNTDITNGTVTPNLTPGALEGSSVSAMEIMVKLIEQSRSFEQQVNMIKESKTTDESGATMMKGG